MDSYQTIDTGHKTSKKSFTELARLPLRHYHKYHILCPFTLKTQYMQPSIQ